MGLPEIGWSVCVWGGPGWVEDDETGADRAASASIPSRPMRLIPWEEERLQLFAAAELARRRRAAGLRLNHPEAVALICDAMLEAARAGATYAEVEAAGRAAVEPVRGARRRPRAARRGPARGAARRRRPGSSRSSTRSAAATPPDPLGPGALRHRRPVGRRRQRRAGGDRARGREPLATADPRLVALPVPPGQPAARVRSRRGPRLPPRPARRGVRGLGAGRDEDRPPRALRRRGRRRTTRDAASPPRSTGPATAPTTGDRVRLGDTDLWIRVGGGPHRARRRAAVGLREEPPLADGAVGRRRGPVGARRRPHRARSSSTPSSAWSRRTSASRTAGSRASAAPAAPRSATASTSSSARTRSRTWRTG